MDMKLKYTILFLALCLGQVVSKPRGGPKGTVAGVCPKPQGLGTCAESCNDCSARNQLCCSNGCGHQCMDPVKPAVTPNECEPNPCPAGEKCVPYPVQCVTTPCPQYRCEASVSKCPNGEPLKVGGQEVFCGRGLSRQDCPATHTCNIDPVDRFAVCCPKPTPDPCSLPMVAGPCRASLLKWYFDSTTKECKQFTYGGCEGNENRFDTLRACNKKCPSKKRGQRTKRQQRRQ